jgi:pimeloyl-ACP methyl ester carboxylesterase
MSRCRKWLVLLLVGSLLLDVPARIVAEPTPPIRPGIIVTVEGIGGVDLIAHSAPAAFKKAGLPHEVRRFVWTHGTGQFLKDLQDTQYLFKKADELAAYLRELRARYPDVPIYVVAKSGGTGLTLFALEKLPPDTVDRVILLSAAVSPGYDLRRALRAVREQVVSFHSRHDQLILNFGTRQFGTIDRYYGPSAGLTGFVTPASLTDEDRALYTKLVQVPWTPRMIREGHTGSHLGTSLPGFLTAEVAPWLR